VARGQKLTLRVVQTRTQQTIHIGTTGKRGTVPLNGINNYFTYSSQSPASDPIAFWTDVINKVLANQIHL
jgi:hypothetical protein